jgi:hypothetical protein
MNLILPFLTRNLGEKAQLNPCLHLHLHAVQAASFISGELKLPA